MASYSNESFSFKWEWPILHPSSLCCSSLFGGTNETSRKLSFLWRILIWIGHYSSLSKELIYCLLIIFSQLPFIAQKYVLLGHARTDEWLSLVFPWHYEVPKYYARAVIYKQPSNSKQGPFQVKWHWQIHWHWWPDIYLESFPSATELTTIH